MTAPATRRWIVRRSNYPFAHPGQRLGVVEATDKTAAAIEAAKEYSGAITVEVETHVNPELERVVDRAVKAAGRRDRAGAYGHAQRRAKPLNRNPDGDVA
jgi:hypothetical protein